MRVLMISKACVVGAYQRKLEELATLPGMELVVLVPPSWRDDRGEQVLERTYTQGYTLRQTPLALNGHFHLHFYPRLPAEIDAIQPDLMHIDEEPYNLATRLAMAGAARRQLPACFFTWQNLNQRYPPPFRWWEGYNYARAAHAIAGNRAAGEVLKAKGFTGPVSVIPQFGIDPDLFKPAATPDRTAPFTIGYAGGLIPAKGLDTLLQACAQLGSPWQLYLAGTGDYEASLRQMAKELAITERISWFRRISSTEMPAFYQSLDVLVLPSRTQRNWMEQFGRVLVEAMACGIPVLGSDSGEIPHVIGPAGRIFPEGDVAALARDLKELMASPDLRIELGELGRQRALTRYTQRQIAVATYEVYQQMLA